MTEPGGNFDKKYSTPAGEEKLKQIRELESQMKTKRMAAKKAEEKTEDRMAAKKHKKHKRRQKTKTED